MGDEEVFVLISIWKNYFEDLKKASNRVKADIFQKMLREMQVEIPDTDATAIKIRGKVRHLESTYNEKKLRLVSTGEAGAKVILNDFPFMDELYSFLGQRDSLNPKNIDIISTVESVNHEPNEKLNPKKVVIY